MAFEQNHRRKIHPVCPGTLLQKLNSKYTFDWFEITLLLTF